MTSGSLLCKHLECTIHDTDQAGFTRCDICNTLIRYEVYVSNLLKHIHNLLEEIRDAQPPRLQ